MWRKKEKSQTQAFYRPHDLLIWRIIFKSYRPDALNYDWFPNKGLPVQDVWLPLDVPKTNLPPGDDSVSGSSSSTGQASAAPSHVNVLMNWVPSLSVVSLGLRKRMSRSMTLISSEAQPHACTTASVKKLLMLSCLTSE